MSATVRSLTTTVSAREASKRPNRRAVIRVARAGGAADLDSTQSAVGSPCRLPESLARDGSGSTRMTVPDISKFKLIDTEELAARIGYAPRTIRNTWVNVVLFENVHFIKPRRKYLFIWENISRDLPMMRAGCAAVPMANGGLARG